ncbi:transcriptional regulator [Nocardia sp. 852002-20019_SCH5090214]|jgi:transcriptional regulator with XRE-family HTH domain|uniref:XRE family transcriptional regulator n=1 Tax=Nocardia nova TaxID=37330 RepID=A0A2S5ZZU9_9NOCA|nr:MULTISPECIES: helix-turn-helix transcriptional regulator [Nocardia]MBV7707496.1 helix-turn-helix domain-containing protein [Nocardia nova]OBA63004.1 transcriptional regulator [Nocardia sp. 852002-20019_SCH5090214]PPI91502.1 XRE family transcriptional regulator [Nocardia nova]PPJ05812.1 XRE family transcriptional regulator [Nocardia nova]PPJ09717.1 XRE family transcriptional regulator [Nocardia nova]
MMAEPVRIGRVDSLVAERGPTALRIAVGGQLRKLREAAGITREAAGEHIRGSHAKISRLELGRTGFKERDVRDLLTLYGVDNAEEREMFLDLVSRANQPGWWHSYNDLLPQWFETYLGLEHASKSIRTFEGQLVPGLLQTEEYTRSVVALGHENAEAARRVELRKKRQEILDRPGAPTLWAVLDEAVLHRPIGGEQVLRAQLEHLVEVSMKPNVTIQVLPYAAGGHAAAGSSFTMLRFAEPELPDIVYLEQLTSALYLDRQQDLELYRQVMDRLSVQAEPPERSREMMKKAAAGLSDSA